jgi:hypothetical protein
VFGRALIAAVICGDVLSKVGFAVNFILLYVG